MHDDYTEQKQAGNALQNTVDKLENIQVTALPDITECKKAEDELHTIFEASLDLICEADINTATFTKVNPAFTSVLGYSKKELLDCRFLDFIHPDD
ncbi:MAG: PAS domain S-box protein, partial [Planctomycetes bacterium]|nr:PAS domain S-box protein [Planctomycetota bacterium]